MARRRIDQPELPLAAPPTETLQAALEAQQPNPGPGMEPDDYPEAPDLTPIQRAHETMRLRREQGIATTRLDPREKARRKPSSLRLAVTAKCWDCVNGSADSNPRARIRECPCPSCPLYPVRPYQKTKSGQEQDDDEGDTVDGEETGT